MSVTEFGCVSGIGSFISDPVSGREMSCPIIRSNGFVHQCELKSSAFKESRLNTFWRSLFNNFMPKIHIFKQKFNVMFATNQAVNKCEIFTRLKRSFHERIYRIYSPYTHVSTKVY